MLLLKASPLWLTLRIVRGVPHKARTNLKPLLRSRGDGCQCRLRASPFSPWLASFRQWPWPQMPVLGTPGTPVLPAVIDTERPRPVATDSELKLFFGRRLYVPNRTRDERNTPQGPTLQCPTCPKLECKRQGDLNFKLKWNPAGAPGRRGNTPPTICGSPERTCRTCTRA